MEHPAPIGSDVTTDMPGQVKDTACVLDPVCGMDSVPSVVLSLPVY